MGKENYSGTAKQRKKDESKTRKWLRKITFWQTRRAKQKVKHLRKKKSTGPAAQYYHKLEKDKAKRRRRRKLVRAQRQGRRI